MRHVTNHGPGLGLTALALALCLGSGCAPAREASPPSFAEPRLPGLPWGLSTPAVTAALVERGFRFAGRDRTGDLRFRGGEMFGLEASLVARMHRDRLVKVVAFMEPRDPDRPREDLDAIVETLTTFYGSPVKEGTDELAWIRRQPDGRPHGVVLRTISRPTYRLDAESPSWPEVRASRETGSLRYATSGMSET